VRYEYVLDDGGKADYVLFDRLGRALGVLEAKSTSLDLSSGEAQGRRYADQLGVPYIFLSNGEEVWHCDKDRDAHFRRVETVFSQDDLIRLRAAHDIRRDPLAIPIDERIAGGGGRVHQTACIDVLCREIVQGRRKLLVEMATGTGKTRTAAALLKRLFEANWTTRALFVVDRNTLAIQAEDTFAEHLPQLPSYRVPRTGRRFQDEKRVTIVTLQTLSIATTLHRSAGGQFIAHAKALPGNPYDGHTLATVIPEIETQIGASLTRIVADRGYRGHNAPPGHKFRVYISGQRRRVTETIKRELRRRSAVEPVIGHAKAEHRMGRNYLAGTHGDAANAVLAAAGYNFRRLLEWLALFLSAVLAALKTAATRQGPFKLV
jgi:hypothetical protein